MAQVSAEEVEAAWRLEDGEALLERRHPNGRLFLRIDSHERDGFRIWAPYYGRHLVALDGCSIATPLARVPPVRWQRLFFAQVLPLSAALQGLSVFHASAAAVRGKVSRSSAFRAAGRPLTAHLVALGASFFTDDVLVLESRPAGVRAYPGPARLSIDKAELGQIPSTQKLPSRAVRRPQRQVNARARAMRLATATWLPLLLPARLRGDTDHDQRA